MVDKMCEKGNKSLNKCIMHAFIIDLSFVKPLYKECTPSLRKQQILNVRS